MKKIPYGRHYLDEEDIQAVTEVLRHGWITQGPKIHEFEVAFADYVGVRYAVAVCNGTAALHMACAAAGIKGGDTVITSPNTFVASANCALYVGAMPQFSDIDPETLNLDPAGLAARCGQLAKVRAIIPVHFGGLPCDMPEIKRIADRHRAAVIEDAAHALGAVYPDGSKVGCCKYADMTTFSFHPVKIITTGEGGMVTTNDETLYRRLLRLRSHGINKLDDPLLNADYAYSGGEANAWYYEMQEIGFNYRLTDIQAVLGLSQMGKLERFLARRRELAAAYDRIFAGVSGIQRTQVEGRSRSANHLYVLRIDFEGLGIKRGALMRRLREKDIVTQVHYIPVHWHPYYQRLGLDATGLPHAERYYAQALSIPLFYSLTDAEQSMVAESLIGALKAA